MFLLRCYKQKLFFKIILVINEKQFFNGFEEEVEGIIEIKLKG